ncbi:hypothetical protein [Bifidobacterium pseudolongum]|uniref:hypothetical protein n=1 Tax=Bifidobacterium pseudolongum TaxID=1694 RepID=UPI0003B3C946|nr:hypothetical protein [Bifidobacterium pseudolongum]
MDIPTILRQTEISGGSDEHSRLAARRELDTLRQLARFIPLAADTTRAERLFVCTVRQRQQAWQRACEGETFFISDRARARVDAEIIDTIENNSREEQE